MFTIDIGNSGDVNVLYEDAMRLNMEDMEQPLGFNIGDETFDFVIYVSSIFNPDDGDVETDLHEPIPQINETDGTPEFEEGENNQNGGFQLINNAYFRISDVMVIPYYHYSSDISFSEGKNVFHYPGYIDAHNGILNVSWDFDVEPDAAPGYRPTEIDIQYTRRDSADIITEQDLPSGLYVAPSTRVTGPIGGPTNAAAFNITYSMTGTPPDVDLYYTKSTSEPYDWVFIGTVGDAHCWKCDQWMNID